MNKLVCSSLFFLMSVITFSMKYIVVAILLAKSGNIDRTLFVDTLAVLPITINLVAYGTLIIGIVLALWFFKENKK